MCQNRLAVPTWSYGMEVLPPARVLELGTYGGGFITALAVHACMIGARVVTYDRMLPDERIAPLGTSLGVSFRQADIWESEHEIAELIAGSGTTYVLCDGGDKPRELAMFARYLKPGDVIAVHDYDAAHEIDPATVTSRRWWPWGEVTQKVAAPIALANGLEPWMQEHFDLAGWLAYRKATP